MLRRNKQLKVKNYRTKKINQQYEDKGNILKKKVCD